MNLSADPNQTPRDPAERDGLLSLGGVDPTRIHREWQLTNTAWAFFQKLAALLLILLLLPLLLVLYLPIRVSTRAPVFFTQKRPGFMGRPFKIFKLRTMRVGSHRHAEYQRGVASNDPNVTRIGRILRETKLDELPQLWNIVRGDMEFVGPRPIAPGLHELLSERIPGFNNRYLVKPGLTNISQISVLENALGDDTLEDWKQRFEGEEHYIRNKSVSYDVILISLTMVYVVRKALRPITRRLRRSGGAPRAGQAA